MRGIPAASACTVALMALACSALPGSQGDPSAPILLTGSVSDMDNKPVAGATIVVEFLDDANAPVGHEPVVLRTTYQAGLDGRYTIHFAPTPELVAMSVQKYFGFLNFQVTAIAPDGSRSLPLRMTRSVGNGTWADLPSDIGLATGQVN
jgi:hypothetical protein